MSANNWARCPRCTIRGNARLETRATEVDAMYGIASVAEFDAARDALAAERAAFEKRDPTFREDYEFYGAEEGTVTASYSGQCQKCGLALKFSEDHPMHDLDEQ